MRAFCEMCKIRFKALIKGLMNKSYVLIPLILSTGCAIGQRYHSIIPKHHYQELVRVYDGFYKGTIGTIVGYSNCHVALANGDLVGSICYNIKLDNGDTIVASEQELTK